MERIAIIGLSCLLPGAHNAQEFWTNLIAGKDSTSTIKSSNLGVEPSVFFDPKKGRHDKFYYMKGGFVRDFQFDASGYSLSPDFLKSLDPIFQTSIHVAKQALQDCHYWANRQILSRCGVILGNLSFPTRSSNQLFAPFYREAIAPFIGKLLQTEDFRLPDCNEFSAVSPYNASLSGLPSAIVAQALALGGIHFSLDAACASSLYAIKLACHQLLSGKADLMLAGAVSYADPLFIRMLFSGVQAYPEDRISRPLDQSSKGVTTAEGVGMLVLKRYRDAVQDGDRIYAIICGNGLSNDGKGKHFLSPNQKGQILAFQRAYDEANLSPRDIDYLECHGTGSLLGDTTELASIDTFFGQHQATPLIGAVKSNVGHLLTTAGIISTIKVLFSMSEGIIPPTINIDKPLESPNRAIAGARLPRSTTQWPNRGLLKRAAISAFGFGGTNAHLILEQPKEIQVTSETDSESPESIPAIRTAIVGMDTHFGTCESLESFERSIYDGNQHFISLPAKRWKGFECSESLLKDYGLAEGKAPTGAYIENLKIDPLQYNIPPNEIESIHPQQLLLLKVADRALKDAGLAKGGNVAVIVAMEAELSMHQLQQRWHLPWQIDEGLQRNNIALTDEQIERLHELTQDGLHKAAQIAGFVGYIGNIASSRISALWDFSGPSFTISAGENSTAKALETAQMLLATGEVDAALVGAVDLSGGLESVIWRNQVTPIDTKGVRTLSYDRQANGWVVGEGAGAVVLKPLDQAKKDRDRIYAAIDSIGIVEDCKAPDNTIFPPKVDSENIKQACQLAFKQAGIKPENVGYLEVSGNGYLKQDNSEIEGLLDEYRSSQGSSHCAIGSVKANIGHTYAASGMASLIKSALCLYHRYIPAVPKWSGPKQPEVWQDGPFYVTCSSQPWLLEEGTHKRVSAINSLGLDGSCAHLILSEVLNKVESSNRYLEKTPLHLLPVAASKRSELLEELRKMQRIIDNCSSLHAASIQIYRDYLHNNNAKYTLVIVGRDKDELRREIKRAFEGIAIAFEQHKDWQTPAGSYFTTKPLGQENKLAFVYPGAFGAYVGLGRDLFRLFPKVYDDRILSDVISRVAPVARRLFPRSILKSSRRQLEMFEKKLFNDPIAMFESELFFSSVTTSILKDYFELKPDCVFGYSLGETSMVYAQGIWANIVQASQALNSSPLFKERISGPKKAVREFWGLGQQEEIDVGKLWGNFVLIETPARVKEYLKDEKQVYLTQINSPQETVIAGKPEVCQRIIDGLKCNAMRAPFNHAIHCDAIQSEYQEIADLNMYGVRKIADITFYSSASYGPIDIESNSISKSIAKNLCRQLDFPRLVNRLYDDGCRIFVEVGASNICTRWISETLKQREYLAVSFNQRGIDDSTSYIRGLAKLVSHKVELDLSQLYDLDLLNVKPKHKNSTNKNIDLGGQNINLSILGGNNKELFQSSTVKGLNGKIKDENITPFKTKESRNLYKQSDKEIYHSPKQYLKKSNVEVGLNGAFKYDSLNNLRDRTMDVNYYSLPQTHLKFLQTQIESIQQMSEIIEMQIACSKKLLKERMIDKEKNEKIKNLEK